MDNYLKEILVVYYGLIVNNQPKNVCRGWGGVIAFALFICSFLIPFVIPYLVYKMSQKVHFELEL